MIDSKIDTSIPQIPNNWKLVRLKDLGTLQNGISKGKDYFGLGHPFVSYGNVYNDTIDLNHIKTLADSTEVDQKQYSVLEGDIFFTRTSETIDEIGISATALRTIPKATFSGFVIRLRPIKRLIHKEYSKYFFQADINRQFLSREISLVTRASLGQNVLNNLPVVLPSISEQINIGNYLNAKTQAIDKKAILLEKKISFYQELRKGIINKTITTGLNEGVKFKESGIEWIGLIPEHWEIKRLKSFARTIKGKNIETSDTPFDNALPLLSLEYLRNDNVKFDTFCYSLDKSLIASKDDLVIVWDGAAVGEILKAKKGYVSSTIAKIEFDRTVNSRFFYFLKDKIDYTLKRIPTGMGIPHLNPTVLNNFPCPIPPKLEQLQIAEYLENKMGLIDKSINNIKSQITTLKELRKTLINDVVTGKIKVIND
jgi:type I restriction enzyme S subunit